MMKYPPKRLAKQFAAAEREEMGVDQKSKRPYKSLRITPAMAAGIADHVWSFEELALLAE